MENNKKVDNSTVNPNTEINQETLMQIKEQLTSIEKREKNVVNMMKELQEAFELLKERNDALNKKEDTLNHEYLKLLELEAMYKGTDKLTGTLSAVLPTLETTNNKQIEEKVEE